MTPPIQPAPGSQPLLFGQYQGDLPDMVEKAVGGLLETTTFCAGLSITPPQVYTLCIKEIAILPALAMDGLLTKSATQRKHRNRSAWLRRPSCTPPAWGMGYPVPPHRKTSTPPLGLNKSSNCHTHKVLRVLVEALSWGAPCFGFHLNCKAAS